MQGSKIKVGETYAVDPRDNGKLQRFRVTEVRIVKKGDHASDQTTSAKGYLVSEGGPVEDRTFHAKDLIGPYEEHAALVAQKQAEDEERQRRKQAEEDEREQLWRKLYQLTGTPIPQGRPTRYGKGVEYDNDVFARGYYNDKFSISTEGVKILVEALERPRLKAVS